MLIQSIINASPDGILIVDLHGVIQFANPAAEALFAKPLAQLRGQPFGFPLVIGETAELDLVPPGWEQARGPAPQQVLEMRVVETTWQDAPAHLAMLRDTTAKRRMQTYVQQQERMAAMGRLAAGIAHDFNNILSVITLYAQMALLSQELAPTSPIRGQLDTIVTQTEHAATLIRQILDFSRRSVVDMQRVNLALLLQEAARRWQAAWPKPIRLHLDVAGSGAEYTLRADAPRLHQVLNNLVQNAQEAMPAGGDLTVRLYRQTIAPRPQRPRSTWPPARGS